MEYYTLLYFPKISYDNINSFRKKYDPYFESWDPHITLVFPVPNTEVSEEDFIRHVQQILENWAPFDISVRGLEKSWDHWLFMTLNTGNAKVIKLHDELYTGVLASQLREDIEFVPHIAIGLFVKKDSAYDLRDPKKAKFDEETYQKALEEAKKMNLGFDSTLDTLSIMKIDSSFTKISLVKTFNLE